MLELIIDPRPSTAVLPRRVLACTQLVVAALIAVAALEPGRPLADPLAALVGVGVLLALFGVLLLAGENGTAPAWRARTLGCSALAALLVVGLGGEMTFSLSVLFLLAIVLGTISPGSRELDLGVGAALGGFATLLIGHASTVSAGEFALVALALTAVVRSLERLLTRARAEASVDPLTGSFNRASFTHRARARLARNPSHTPLVVVMIDLDDFGVLNKRRGHLVGDELLRLAARRMTLAVGSEGVVGRLGGDEFAAIASGGCAETLGRKVLAALLAGPEPISASIGVASIHEDGCELMVLLREADVALRAAKRGGKSQVVVFSESIDTEAQLNRRHVQDVIDQSLFEVVVQPIVDLKSGRVRAYEALTRFAAPGPASPAHWLSMAQSLGMRVELELACLARSLSLLEDLPEGARLSVNLSALALADPRTREVLREADCERLIIELTEEGLGGDLRSLRAAIDPLLSAGAKLAVDDMGAGYSNLRQVVELAASLLKLDRTLIHRIDRDPAQRLLIDALTGYAQRTGAEIVAEGIETEAELEIVRALGITYGQGYLLAPPASPWPELKVVLSERPVREAAPLGSQPVTIPPATTTDEARTRFMALPELESLVIVDAEHRPLGLLTRGRLLATLGHRFGYALWGEKPVLRIADTNFLCVTVGCGVEELAHRSLARPLEQRHDPVLQVDAQGRLVGQVTISDMLLHGRVDPQGTSAEPPGVEARQKPRLQSAVA